MNKVIDALRAEIDKGWATQQTKRPRHHRR
jgi:hypothetical protein